MKNNLTPIASAVALLIMSTAVAAQAQEAASQEVVVTGIRAAAQQSLNQKRNAESHLEVITAEDIGKMPDKNIADSLQRVPGVTTSSASGNEGGFDENDRVSMRGTNPSLTQTLINGHNMAAGDWFVLNQSGPGVGRSISYTLLPSELVSRVEVHKSSEASLVEGGVAGSIDVITRKPLDFKKALTAEVSLGAVYADLPKKTDPQIGVLFNWKNETNTVGVMVQAFSEKRSLRRDGQEILGYEKIGAASPVAQAHPDLAGVWYPTLIGSAAFEQVRKRQGGLIDVQIKPTNDFSLDFNAFSSKLDAANYNRNYLQWNTHFINQGLGQAPDPGYVITNTNGVKTLTKANFTGIAGNQYGIYDQISRPDAGSDTNFFNVDANWRVSNTLKLSGQLGTSTGTGKTPTQNIAEFDTGKGTGAGYALNGIGSAASWNLGSQNNASPAGTGLDWIFGDQQVSVKDKETWAKLDGEYAINQGVFTTLKFGIRGTEHKRNNDFVNNQAPLPGAFNNLPTGTISYPSNFGSGLGGGFPTNIWSYTPAQLAAFNAQYANRPTDGSRENWASEFALKENTTAAYVQSNLEGQGWSGNIGLRFVETKEKITLPIGTTADAPGAITTSLFGPFIRQQFNNTYHDVLPSANLRVDLSKDLVGRLAISKTMTRPDYGALASAISLSPPAVVGGVGSGSGANPDLKPIRSNNFDASLEWYFAPRSLLSAGLFYMDLTSYVGVGQVTKSYLTYSSLTPQGAFVPYILSVPTNTSATVKGAELSYEQPLGKFFGLSANYTYADAKDADDNAVVGASKNTYNFSGYFENDKFNARVSYSYRSSFFSGLDRETAFSQAASGAVSASLGYKISDNLSIALDMQNLNNPKLKYYALNEDQPRSVYQSGRQFYLTLRAKM
ncbi:TonB-dependent receptor [Undibacterium sp.]|uniref:TonB-dependent receptor n=1 Tax=Undibacterium sp. TaxID=1914977 RepID=UPI00374DA8C0